MLWFSCLHVGGGGPWPEERDHTGVLGVGTLVIDKRTFIKSTYLQCNGGISW